MYGSDLTPRQREILATWGVKPAARGKAHASLGVSKEEIAVLHYSGFLKTLPTGGVYLADGGTLVLGAKMRERLVALYAQLGREAPCEAPAPVAPKAPKAAAAPRAPRPPKEPKAPRLRAEYGPTFHRNPESEASARSVFQAALEAHRAGETVEIRGIRVPVGRPAEPALGATCVAWRRKIARGEPLLPPAVIRPVSIYSTSAKGELAARPRTVTDLYLSAGKVVRRWHHGATRLGRIFHPRTAVDCPQCQEIIPLAKWWEHGCPRALVRREETLGDFDTLTAGAAAPVYPEAAAEAA